MATKPLIASLAGALILRLAFVFIGFPALEQRWQLREDGDGYLTLVTALNEGRFEDPTRGPLYVLFAAVCGSAANVKVAQAILDTATCLLVFWLARGDWRAAALWAVYPFAIWRVGFINREIVLTFLLAGYACAQWAAWRDQKLWQWLAAGVCLGLVNLCKPTFLVGLIVMVIVVVAKRRAVLPAVALLAGAVIALAPWSYAIHRATGGEQFLPVARGQGGMTAFIGNYQPSLGLTEGPGRIKWMAAVDEIRGQNAGRSPAELDRAFYGAAWQQVRSNPLKAIELTVRKAGRFWFTSAKRRELPASVLIQGTYLALLGFGLWRAWPWCGKVGLMVGLIAYLWLLHALSYADLRYSLPVMPLVCALAFARRDS